MVDGKVCSALSKISTCKCYICDAKPSKMNGLEKWLKKKCTKNISNLGCHNCTRIFGFFNIYCIKHIDCI